MAAYMFQQVHKTLSLRSSTESHALVSQIPEVTIRPCQPFNHASSCQLLILRPLYSFPVQRQLTLPALLDQVYIPTRSIRDYMSYSQS